VVHNAWKVNNGNINMSVEVWDYKPVHINELLEFIRKIKFNKINFLKR
jgi:calcineurin-like phosphoesterase family protein